MKREDQKNSVTVRDVFEVYVDLRLHVVFLWYHSEEKNGMKTMDGKKEGWEITFVRVVADLLTLVERRRAASASKAARSFRSFFSGSSCSSSKSSS